MKLRLFPLLILVSVGQIKSHPNNSHLARSCLDYSRGPRSENGFHWLFDDQDKRYVAYCDLSSEPGAAWTLFMSWARKYKDLPQFRSKAFMQDAPINHNTPDWYIYRQTLARMKSLRSRSTYWRATCNFNGYMMKHFSSFYMYSDDLRGKFSNFDIMTFDGSGRCFPVDYVNIRGHVAGSGATAQFWQRPNGHILHIDSSSTGCSFKPNAGSVGSEDNFGYYGQYNRNFRCTRNYDDTTNWWFGAYMAD